MYSFISKCLLNEVHVILKKESVIFRMMTLKNSPMPTERSKRHKIDSDQIIQSNYININKFNTEASSTAQSHAVTTVHHNTVRTEMLPLLKQNDLKELPESLTKTKRKLDETLDRTSLPYEEIPSPAIFRLWEKYWKYVPLFGRLSWTRNITPVKHLFNQYGPIVRISGPIAGNVVMIHKPEHIAEVFKQEGDYPVRSGIDILQHYRLHHRKYKMPSLYSMQGSEWLEMRAKIEEPFSEQIYQNIEKVEMACEELVQRIRRIRNRQDEVPGSFSEDLSRWSMECFAILMFNKKIGFLEPSGYNVSSEQTRIIEALETAHRCMSYCESGFQVWRFVDTPYLKKLYGACDVIDGVIGKYIRHMQNKIRSQVADIRKNEAFTTDFSVVEKLLCSQSMQPEDVSVLLMDSIILGVQAITNTQAFLLYSIAKNPRVQRKIFEEVDSVMSNRDSHMTEKKLKSMTYLRMCLQECLRLYPAFPYITRMLQKTISLHGYKIPKGTYVIMANKIASEREENFEDPEKFRPERWFSNNSQHYHVQQYSCLPFGHGVRSCVGKNMAEMEIMLLTAKILREFRVEYDYADIGSKFYMVSVPNKPLRFRFVDRE